MKKICLFWAGICLVAAVATACGGGYSTTTGQPYGGTTTYGATTTATTDAGATPAAAGAATITIDNFSYGEPLTVSPGATVSVTNNDSAEHSVTSQTAGQFDVDVEGGGESGTFTAPTQPGEYAFYCTYHPSMKGTLIVQ